MLPKRRKTQTSVRSRHLVLSIILSTLLVTAYLQGSSNEERHHVVREAYLMGTMASLEIHSADRGSGLDQLEEFLGIMERTDAELTTWKGDSTISRFNIAPLGVEFPLEAGTCRLVGKVVDLHQLSNGAFDPAVGRLLAAWGVYGSARLPTATELETSRSQSGLHLLSFSPEECLATRQGNILLDSGAFWKGEALDRVRAYSEENVLDPWLINLGGQVAVHGHPPGNDFWQVDISSPVDREKPYTTLNLARGSLATSGNSERGVEVGHILDPRTGQPSLFSGSVTVWHKQALVADALSTALHVMGSEEGIEWANLNEIAVCFISVSESGHIEIRRSRLFDRLVLP